MFEQIKYLVLDVDGTMTDAGIYYDSTGNEICKKVLHEGRRWIRGGEKSRDKADCADRT